MRTRITPNKDTFHAVSSYSCEAVTTALYKEYVVAERISVSKCSHQIYCPEFQIAALSPADINYDETLSTLRFGKNQVPFY